MSDSKNESSTRLVPIASFVRIKPIIETDEKGGKKAAAEKRISSWDEEHGKVEISGIRGGIKSFDHMTAALPPDASQVRVYEAIAAPLVSKFLDGFDVDLISYGQTGSGKTYTMFGPPNSMAEAAAGLGDRKGGESILKEEHGFILRAGFETLAAVAALEQSSMRATLHGSMVEVSILGMRPCDQTACDLLNKRVPCYVDDTYHLQGAKQLPLRTAADVVNLAAAVEARLTRSTKMNDASSRSHCICALTLTVATTDADAEANDTAVRESRLQFFDLMGSERFKGPNAAHDASKSCKATMGGCEGIFANLSLQALMTAVELSTSARRKSKNKSSAAMKKECKPMGAFLLTKLMMNSFAGDALTAMVTCLSQAPHNGEETYLSLKYGGKMAAMLNAPAPRPFLPLHKVLAHARKQHAASSALVAKGVQGKYQAQRRAEVSHWLFTVDVLEALAGESSAK